MIVSRYRRRLLVNRFNLAMSMATMTIGMLFLFWILAVLFMNGLEALSPALFTQSTPPPGSAGGLENALYGSLLIVGIATLVADYTEESPEIKEWLGRFGRDGIPLTVIFPAGRPDEPILLDGVFSQRTLIEKLEQAVASTAVASTGVKTADAR